MRYSPEGTFDQCDICGQIRVFERGFEQFPYFHEKYGICRYKYVCMPCADRQIVNLINEKHNARIDTTKA